MTNQLWKAMLASPAVLGVAMAGSAIATEAPTVESVEAAAAAEPVQLAQVATVDELSDVFPSDWAYTALQNLVETYGCIEGYPNRTFRGNQALTRYEFAAGLNACLDVLATLITGGVLIKAPWLPSSVYSKSSKLSSLPCVAAWMPSKLRPLNSAPSSSPPPPNCVVKWTLNLVRPFR
jgi:hypothetical protein